MNKFRSFIGFCGVAIATCCAEEVQHVWDFSKTHNTNQVPWPEPQDKPVAFHDLEIKSNVKVLFLDGKEFSSYVRRISFEARGDDLMAVVFKFEPQKLDAVTQTAREIGRYWDLPIEKVDGWKKEQRDDHMTETLLLQKSWATHTVSLEIFPSFNAKNPFVIQLRYGWPIRT